MRFLRPAIVGIGLVGALVVSLRFRAG